MDKNKIFIAKKTLNLLEKKQWNNISLSTLLDKKNIALFKNKNELLININRYFDYLLKKNLTYLEQSSSKDMLFEVLMARLDILNTHRKSVKKILKYFPSHPHQAIKLIPSFIESIILISTLSNVEISGVKGAAKIKALFILYILTIYTWSNDESDSLEKTMTILDQYLTNFDKLINLT